MRTAISAVSTLWGPVPIRVIAQTHLQAFFESVGFSRIGADYLEYGAPHLLMLRETTTNNY
jgi:ElaA protein